MIVTKEMLMKEIASFENENIAIVRKVFDGLEDTIMDYLSSTTPSDNTVIKLFDGLYIECNYVPPKEMKHPGTRKHIVVPEKIWANAKVTRHLNRKLNAV